MNYCKDCCCWLILQGYIFLFAESCRDNALFHDSSGIRIPFSWMADINLNLISSIEDPVIKQNLVLAIDILQKPLSQDYGLFSFSIVIRNQIHLKVLIYDTIVHGIYFSLCIVSIIDFI